MTPKDEQGILRKPIKYLQLFWGIYLAIFVVLVSVWFFITFHNVQSCFQIIRTDSFNLLVSNPMYFSPNEIEKVILTIENNTPETREVRLLINKSEPSVALVGIDDSNIAFEGPISGQTYKSKSIEVLFVWNQENSIQNARTNLEVVLIESTLPPDVKSFPMCGYIAPLPWMRLMGNISGPVLVGFTIWLIKEKWDEAKSSAR